MNEQEKAKIVTNIRDNDAPILIVDENIAKHPQAQDNPLAFTTITGQ